MYTGFEKKIRWLELGRDSSLQMREITSFSSRVERCQTTETNLYSFVIPNNTVEENAAREEYNSVILLTSVENHHYTENSNYFSLDNNSNFDMFNDTSTFSAQMRNYNFVSLCHSSYDDDELALYHTPDHSLKEYEYSDVYNSPSEDSFTGMNENEYNGSNLDRRSIKCSTKKVLSEDYITSLIKMRKKSIGRNSGDIKSYSKNIREQRNINPKWFETNLQFKHQSTYLHVVANEESSIFGLRRSSSRSSLVENELILMKTQMLYIAEQKAMAGILGGVEDDNSKTKVVKELNDEEKGKINEGNIYWEVENMIAAAYSLEAKPKYQIHALEDIKSAKEAAIEAAIEAENHIFNFYKNLRLIEDGISYTRFRSIIIQHSWMLRKEPVYKKSLQKSLNTEIIDRSKDIYLSQELNGAAKKRLCEKSLKLLGLLDLGVNIEIWDTDSIPASNRISKSSTYYGWFKIPHFETQDSAHLKTVDKEFILHQIYLFNDVELVLPSIRETDRSIDPYWIITIQIFKDLNELCNAYTDHLNSFKISDNMVSRDLKLYSGENSQKLKFNGTIFKDFHNEFWNTQLDRSHYVPLSHVRMSSVDLEPFTDNISFLRHDKLHFRF